MAMTGQAYTILIAEDDENDALLLLRAIRKTQQGATIHVVQDGGEAISYLKGEGRFSDRNTYAFPRVLISDLKMPRKSGFELLQWLREHPECHLVPILILSSSNVGEDIVKAYQLGVNAYFQKPAAFDELVSLFELVFQFWLRAEIPPANASFRCK